MRNGLRGWCFGSVGSMQGSVGRGPKRARRRQSAVWLAPLLVGSLLVSSAPSVAEEQAEGPFGSPTVSNDLVTWSAVSGHGAVLTARGPGGSFLVKKEFAKGEEPWLDLADLGGDLGEGEVNYSLRMLADIDLAALRAQVEAGERPESALQEAERLVKRGARAQTGGWAVMNGSFVATPGTPSEQPEVVGNADADGGLQIKTQFLDIIGEDLVIESGNIDIVMVDTNSGGAGAWAINIDEPGPNDFAIQSDQNGVTGGANAIYPFIIQNSTNIGSDEALVIASGGDIGFGTSAPAATLHVAGSDGDAQLLIEENNSDANVEVMFNLVCNCAPGFRMQNTVNGETWFFRHTSAGDFSLDNVGGAGLEARFDTNGNLFLLGSLSQGSSRALKEALEPADGDKVLETLTQLDLYEWSYIGQSGRHFGPMAEDFSAAYGLGESEAKIAPADMAGLALAAAKTLTEKNTALESENQKLELRLGETQAQLGSMLERLEALEQQ